MSNNGSGNGEQLVKGKNELDGTRAVVGEHVGKYEENHNGLLKLRCENCGKLRREHIFLRLIPACNKKKTLQKGQMQQAASEPAFSQAVQA